MKHKLNSKKPYEVRFQKPRSWVTTWCRARIANNPSYNTEDSRCHTDEHASNVLESTKHRIGSDRSNIGYNSSDDKLFKCLICGNYHNLHRYLPPKVTQQKTNTPAVLNFQSRVIVRLNKICWPECLRMLFKSIYWTYSIRHNMCVCYISQSSVEYR